MLVVDSGLGGVSVVRALKVLQPELELHYLADTAYFPYGARSAKALNARANTLIGAAINALQPSVIVLACNTLSTLCLQSLRAQFDVPFVGTVPPIKMASSLSKTRRFTLLATPNTVASTYSADLIESFARDCVVDRYGAPNLAQMAEAFVLHGNLDMQALREEIAPCFHDDACGKTDAVALGCTHYPLIMPQLAQCSPWGVSWVDASEAIARQAMLLLGGGISSSKPARAWITNAQADNVYHDFLAREGFASTQVLPNLSTPMDANECLSTCG